MTLIPRSIHGRMLALSALAIALALGIAALGIGRVLERFVMQSLDQRLDAELALLASAVDDDGTVDRGRLTTTRALLASGPGWSWRIETPRQRIGSTDFPELAAPAPPLGAPLAPPPGPPRPRADDAPRALDSDDRDGRRLHARQLRLDTGGGPVTLTAAAPRALIERPIRAALVPLLAALLVLGLSLAAATLIQLRLGLRPLRALRDRVAAIRMGAATMLPEDQPDELRPLAVELNALIADNHAALATARASAANLAHGLKTPIATLGLTLGEPGRDPDGLAAAQVARIDATVRHHLARARSAVFDTRAITPLTPALTDMAQAMRRLHAERGIAIACDLTPVSAAIDAHDLDELAGNLIDNAIRHARTQVRVATRVEGRTVRLTVSDDGPGIPAADRERATTPGARLDERGDGHGFGLAIARELAALHGGALHLDDAPGGGLVASVSLPLARGLP